MRVWGQEVAKYLEWLGASGASRSTLRLRRHYLSHLAERCMVGPWDVTLDDLVALQATPNWAPETRKSARSAVRGFYSWAVDTGRLSSDPSRRLPAVRVPPGRPKPTPPLVVSEALASADPTGRRMLLLALLAGLRRSEIARCHTRDLTPDLLGYSLRVTGKGGKVRVIPIHPALATDIAALPAGFLFPGRDDGHLSPHWVGVRLARMLGPGWSGHTLRHRFATEAYAVERDLFAVQQLLGHSKPETTARYVQMPDSALRNAVTGLSAWVPDTGHSA